MNNYQNQALHVTTRTAFPEGLKADLIDGGFTDWQAHPQFQASGATLHRCLNRLRNACESLTGGLGQQVLRHKEEAYFSLAAACLRPADYQCGTFASPCRRPLLFPTVPGIVPAVGSPSGSVRWRSQGAGATA